MIVATWALPRKADEVVSFADGSGHVVRFNGRILGGVYTSKRAACKALAILIAKRKEQS